ncbi:MAG: hypothetical protein H0X40_08345 [Chthoniobacterales bacterium]|nr:hypothetical protein [Chthoniobacterales bacterium]
MTNYTSSTLSKIRASDGAPLGTFPSGVTSPLAMVFDGANLWVIGETDPTKSVSKIRPSDGAILAILDTGTSPAQMVFDGANVWVTDQSDHTVTKIRVSDNVIVGTYSVSSAFGLAFDGTNMWVGNNLGSTLTKIRASDGVILGTFTVGRMPGYLASDGATVWSTFFIRAGKPPSNVVTMLRTKNGARAGSLTVGTSTSEIYYDGTNFWVGDDATASVSKFTKN